MTPAEFCCYVRAFEKKELQNLNNNITTAWHTEYFARQKKLDKITKYIISDKKKSNNSKKKKMSKEEIEKHYKNKVVK